MKHKIIVALLAAALGFIGFVAEPIGAAPNRPDAVVALTDTVSADHTVAICTMRKASRPELANYWGKVRTIHYGTAHVTQCWWTSTYVVGMGTYSYCDQYVWKIANPYWHRYAQGFYPTVKCW